MTLDQVKLIRDALMQPATRPDGRKSCIGEYLKIVIDDQTDLVTSKDCIFWDDDNKIITAVCINDDMKSQADFPIKVITAEYDKINMIESILSAVNFKTFMDNGFIKTSEEKKKFAIENFLGSITNQAQQPMDAEPHWNTNPKTIPMHTSRIKREAVVISGAQTVREDGTIANYNSVAEALNDLHNGDVLTIGENVILDAPINVEPDISATINLNKHDIESSSSEPLFTVNAGSKLEIVGSGIIKSSGKTISAIGDDEKPAEVVIGTGVAIVSTDNVALFVRNNVDVTVNGIVQTETGAFAAIQGNGLDQSNKLNLTIDGGIVINELDCAIYWPNSGKLTIKGNSQIIGNTAIYIKAGELIVEDDAFIRGIGPASKYKYSANGCYCTGDAIVADYCVYPGGVPSIHLHGGTITSDNALAFAAYDKDGNLWPESAADKIIISGGSYNTEVHEDYILQGYGVVVHETTGLNKVIAL